MCPSSHEESFVRIVIAWTRAKQIVRPGQLVQDGKEYTSDFKVFVSLVLFAFKQVVRPHNSHVDFKLSNGCNNPYHISSMCPIFSALVAMK